MMKADLEAKITFEDAKYSQFLSLVLFNTITAKGTDSTSLCTETINIYDLWMKNSIRNLF